MNDASELERLRARVAELEAQLPAGKTPTKDRTGARRSRWWAAGSATLITVACVLAPLSVAAVWASTELSDTDEYVDTVAPLADDPAVQDALAVRVTAVIFENLDVEGITTEALETLAAQENVPPRVADALPGLAVPITNGVETFTRDQVDAFLASDAFATIWERVNRVANEQIVSLLDGGEGEAVTAQGDVITLNLGPIIAEVKARLLDRGFDLAANIPEVDRSFVLVQSEGITQAQDFYSLLNTLGVWLPVIALVLFVAGVVLARDRRRAVIKGALGVVFAMIVLGVGLALARGWYVGATPGDVLTAEAAGGVFDTLVRFLRTGIRATAVLALIVVLAAFLIGPSTAAVRARSALGDGIGALRRGPEALGWGTGRLGDRTHRHKRTLQISAAIAGGLVLLFWTQPTGWVVIWTAASVLLALAVVEFLARPPAQAEPVTVGAEGPPGVPRQVRRTPADQTAEKEATGAGERPEQHDGNDWGTAAQREQAYAHAAPPPQAAPTAPMQDPIEQLKDLAELKAQGILTEEEFAAQKARILGT